MTSTSYFVTFGSLISINILDKRDFDLFPICCPTEIISTTKRINLNILQ